MGDGTVSYCNADFLDAGGGGSYGDNESFTMVICSGNHAEDPSSMVQLAFNTFSLGAGDMMIIYDGVGTGGPVLETGTGTNFAGMVVQAADASGCVTVVFQSDGSGTGTGWTGLITCSVLCTPPIGVVAPTGLLELCQDEPGNVSAAGSAATAGHTIVDYLWDVGNGTATGQDIVVSYPDGGQYPIELTLVDDIGCITILGSNLSIRVPTTPDFIGSNLLPEEICLNDPIALTGTVNGHEWTNVPQPILAGVTMLPDGSGISYSTSIQVSGFPDGLTITSGTDIVEVCLVIEHSYLGDLQVTLTAPNGQTVVLFAGFGGGGGGTYLGEANDLGTGVPGVGSQYCFSLDGVFGTMIAENVANNHVIAGQPPGESMTPGNYTAQGSFNNWIGSMLNGSWTITVTDNLLADDGTIFSWWIVVDPSLYPDVITFTPVYPPSDFQWIGDGVGPVGPDGSAVATPTTEGSHIYTFQVTDDFGCVWDSSFTVTVGPPPLEFTPATLSVCDDEAPFSLIGHLSTVPAGMAVPITGTWIGPGGTPHSGVFNGATDEDGTYTYLLGENGLCESQGTIVVTTGEHVDTGDDATLAYCSSTDPFDLFTVLTGDPQTGGSWHMPDASTFDGTLVPGTMPSGVYTYHLSATWPCMNDTTFLTIAIPQAVDAGIGGSVEICRSEAVQPLFDRLTGTPDTGGNWTLPGGSGFNGVVDPASAVSGNYTYSVPTDAPCPMVSATLAVHFEPIPYSGVDASIVLCANDPQLALIGVLGGSPDTDGQWTDPLGSLHSGTLDPSLEVSGRYVYVTIGSGVCGHLSDTAYANVLINTLPKITFEVEPDSGCHPLDVVLTNTTDPIYVGGGCIWTLGDGSATVESCNAVLHTYEQPGWYHVKLRMTTPQGCTDELVKPGAVLVQPAPKATFVWTPEIGIPGQSTFTFTATDPYASVFDWTFPKAEETRGDRQVQRFFQDALSAQYEVCLHVEDRYGCADSLCQMVTVEVPSVFIPSTFTPNGDGVNDKLQILGTGFQREDFLFQAFDRWGHLVYETNNAGVEWDGQHRKGGLLPNGTYVWVLKARPIGAAEEMEYKGYVNLLR